jgi:hypothetical protein
MCLPRFVPTLLKFRLLCFQDIRKDCRALDVAILHKATCTPISKAHKCTRGFGGEVVTHVREDEVTLAEYALHANRRTCCCKKMEQISVSRNVAIPVLTGFGVIVKGHPIEVWILATVIVPPPQKIIVRDVFRFCAEVVAHFVDGVDGKAIQRDIIEHVLGLRWRGIL